MARRDPGPASRRAVALTALIAALGLPGCALSRGEPPPIASVQPLPQQWVLAPPGGAEVPFDRYWTMLDDPLANEFVAQAQAGNLDLAQAVTRVRAARAGLRQARAGFLPTVSGRAGGQRDVGDFARDGVQFSVGADVAWEADLFGRIDASADAARSDLQAAGYSLADLERVIVAQVVPTAIEYQAISKAANKAREGNSVAEVRSIFDKAAAVDNISTISGKDLDVSKEGEKIVVGFDYQREIHLAGPAYLTLKYTGRTP